MVFKFNILYALLDRFRTTVSCGCAKCVFVHLVRICNLRVIIATESMRSEMKY